MLVMDAQELPEEDTNSGKTLDDMCSEEGTMRKEKHIRMRDTRITLFIEIELLTCGGALHWWVRCQHCAVIF